MLAMFCSYALQVTFISININYVMYKGGMFPLSFRNSPFLMFIFSWAQGISNFGFIIMICALLPSNMYPKLAAKWGTLIYFGSSFADFTVQRPGVSEKYKIFISMIFPSVATARACKNVAMIEYSTGGSGLDWWNLFEPFQEYRVHLYFLVMVWGFWLHLIIGLFFERFGGLVGFWDYMSQRHLGDYLRKPKI
jgi:hypothetical protein